MVLPVDSDSHWTIIALILVILIFCFAGTDLNNHLLPCVEFSHHLVDAVSVDLTGLTKLDFPSRLCSGLFWATLDKAPGSNER
jgi:hypothetical protein